MRSNKSFLLTALVPVLALSGCYHEFAAGGGGGGGGGNGGISGNTIVYFTVTASPSQTFSFPVLAWPIAGIQFINSSGAGFGVASPLPIPDFARLQTDSLFLGHGVIPAGAYSSVKIQLNGPFPSYFYNSSTSTVAGCASGAVCVIPASVAGFGASTVTVPFTLNAQGGQSIGVDINFDLSKAVTSAGGMTFDFTQSGAIVPSILPRKGQSTGIDSLENFTGPVTAKTSTSITVQPLKSISVGAVFTMASTVEFDDPFSICSAPASFSCLAVGQNVSIDGVINADGSMTAYEVDFLDPAPGVAEFEGVIVSPPSGGTFQMVITNEMNTTFFNVGTLLTVNLNGSETYFIDPKNLGVSTSVLGFESSTDLVLGQTVMLKGGAVTDSTETLTNPTRVLLRYSSIPGTVSAPSIPTFTLSSIEPFFVNLTNNSALVQTFPTTTVDNITALGSLTSGTNASVRALYLNPSSGATPPILATKVRTH